MEPGEATVRGSSASTSIDCSVKQKLIKGAGLNKPKAKATRRDVDPCHLFSQTVFTSSVQVSHRIELQTKAKHQILFGLVRLS